MTRLQQDRWCEGGGRMEEASTTILEEEWDKVARVG